MSKNAKRFIVFQGAPTISQLRSDQHLTYSWSETIINSANGNGSTVHPAPTTTPVTNDNLSVADAELSSFFPPGTFEEASRRISLLYRNVIFNEDDAEDEEERQRQLETTLLELDVEGGEKSGWDDYSRPGSEHTRRDETTVISWPPTYDDSSASASPSPSALAMPPPPADCPAQNDGPEHRGSSMLLASSSQAETSMSISQRSYAKNTGNISALLSRPAGGIQNADMTGMTTMTSFFLSQEENKSSPSIASSTTTLLSTDNSISISNTAAYASAMGNTSIGHFPHFTFSMHTLSSLSSLANPAACTSGQGQNKGKGTNGKANLLLVVLEVDGPQTIQLRRGPQAGMSISLLKLVVADDDSGLARLVVWRELADIWAGGGGGRVSTSTDRQQKQQYQYQQILEAGGVKRGDVIYLENISHGIPTDSNGPFFNQQKQQSLMLTASSNLDSYLTICYRAMPEPVNMWGRSRNNHVLRSLRPDLRLGASDAGVRRVAALVAWFERMAGLS